MRLSRRSRTRLALLAVLAAGFASALWLGLVPQRFSPFAPLNLDEPASWFLDFRLASLNADARHCAAVIASPLIDASPITDQPITKGCGWQNGVRMSAAGGVKLTTDKITCGMAAALSMWLAHEVRPAAAHYLKSDIKSVRHMGVYACRNILGSPSLKSFRSQHATANAIDIESFALADGRTISVLKNWKGSGNEAQFLRAIHERACRYFRVALGPDYNAAHANHFHFDRGAFKRCR
ncbi:MAG: extensin family protein [Hyphomicrobium sp.]|jgi:hypothetical protein|nr:extensin family protein [Hyphomicrobium sp.]